MVTTWYPVDPSTLTATAPASARLHGAGCRPQVELLPWPSTANTAAVVAPGRDTAEEIRTTPLRRCATPWPRLAPPRGWKRCGIRPPEEFRRSLPCRSAR